MNFEPAILLDIAGMIVGLFLTLAIFSYLFGDNFLFRLAIAIFIGVTAGFVLVVSFYTVIYPQLIYPLLALRGEEQLFSFVPFALGVLLLFKLSPRLSSIGNPSMAFLVGVGAAAVLGGAISGTLFSQIGATINLFDPAAPSVQGISPLVRLGEGGFILLGVVTAVAYFHFTSSLKLSGSTRRPEILEIIAGIGKFFIVITLGVIFAGVLSACLVAFLERSTFILDLLRRILQIQ